MGLWNCLTGAVALAALPGILAGDSLRGSHDRKVAKRGSTTPLDLGVINVPGVGPIRIPGSTDVTVDSDGISISSSDNSTQITVNSDGVNVSKGNGTTVAVGSGGVNVTSNGTQIVTSNANGTQVVGSDGTIISTGTNGTQVVKPDGTIISTGNASGLTGPDAEIAPGAGIDIPGVTRKPPRSGQPPARRLGVIDVPGMGPITVPGSTDITVRDDGVTIDDHDGTMVTVDQDGGVNVTSSTGNVTVGNDGRLNITANGTSITTGTNGTTTVVGRNGTISTNGSTVTRTELPPLVLKTTVMGGRWMGRAASHEAGKFLEDIAAKADEAAEEGQKQEEEGEEGDGKAQAVREGGV